MSRRDEEVRRHEYLLQEIRLTGEDIKADLSDKFEKKIEKIEHRITMVERWQLSIASAFAGVVAWWKYGQYFRGGGN